MAPAEAMRSLIYKRASGRDSALDVYPAAGGRRPPGTWD